MQVATTVSLNDKEVMLSESDIALVREATDLRLLDLHDGLGADLQAFIPRLGGWTLLANFNGA